MAGGITEYIADLTPEQFDVLVAVALNNAEARRGLLKYATKETIAEVTEAQIKRVSEAMWIAPHVAKEAVQYMVEQLMSEQGPN